MGTISSDNADIMYTEQLLDEMISFITRDESTNSVAECAERTLVRKAAAVVRAPKLECQPKVMGKSQISARSQAHTQGETFTSILKNLKSFTNESRELFDNVFTVGPAYHKRSWWNIVTSKKSSRTRGRKSLSRSLPLPQFPKSDTSYRAEKIWSPEVVGESMTELNPTSLREEVAIRLQHMNRQLIGQLRFEERVLEIFERFYGVYNPYECFKMKLDMERDIDDGDSSDTVYQKKIQRLRFVLSAPPCKLPPDRKPDFGEQCASVISSPDEADMNRLMLGISPFWKGPLLKSNTKCFYLTRTGRRMHDKDEFYLPLEDDYKEFYLEDLEDYRDPAVFRRDYSNMERLWEQLQKLQIKLSESVATEDIPRGDWISRRRLARCKDSDDVICLGSVQTDVLKVLQDFDKPLDDEKVQEFLKMGESAQEILASAFKAIRQTTLLMIQTRNAILELVHSVGQNCDEDEDDEQYESADDEEDFNRQLEQAIQESCQELQSTSKT
ncbi:hypothetical protein KIN20_033552 [Parelaphostrongylus tenuis]|uniref:Uncharacterized protein n=1 Tax=Parelaphostrongylus tenuis TaxID=148309 RepID=A0AAD5R8W5_PARTN|nr:hypothetical protein KIN20_033552 [Parelaphostrongylus tenuis]